MTEEHPHPRGELSLRTVAAMLADTESGRRYFRRLDHVADGSRGRRRGEFAGQGTRGDRRCFESELSAAGESGRCGLCLYRGQSDWPEFDYARS